ncbi:MAG: DUF3109 family protein [Candidatus Ozemobacteraceae bacterium]
MYKIENVLISDEAWETHFACDIEACKGACCRIGDLGAPIDDVEEHRIMELLPEVLPWLPRKNALFLENGIGEVWKGEHHIREMEPNHPCPLGFINDTGVLLCSLHRYAIENHLPLIETKPLWCLSFPLIFRKSFPADEETDSSPGISPIGKRSSSEWIINLSLQPHCRSKKNAGPVLLEFSSLLEPLFGKPWMETVRKTLSA